MVCFEHCQIFTERNFYIVNWNYCQQRLQIKIKHQVNVWDKISWQNPLDSIVIFITSQTVKGQKLSGQDFKLAYLGLCETLHQSFNIYFPLI